MLENPTADIVTGSFDTAMRKLEFMSEATGSHRRLLSGAVIFSSELFFGEIFLPALVGRGWLEWEEMR